MSNTGVTRQIDRNGRLVIPKEIRDRFGLDIGAYAEIFVEGDYIMIRRQEAPACIFCGGEHKLTLFGGKPVCAKCAKEIAASTAHD